MPKLLVVYGTTEGQTRRVAERAAGRARERGWEAEVHDATAIPAGFDPGAFDAAVVAASLHQGRHQSSVEHFVRAHRAALEGRPSAFLSVSLSAAGDADDRRDASACVEKFLDATGWAPARVHLVAGAFRFSQYDFFKRWIMKRIAREKGVATDGRHDLELTDWAELDGFTDSFLAAADRGPP